jgi:hypothetical protein
MHPRLSTNGQAAEAATVSKRRLTVPVCRSLSGSRKNPVPDGGIFPKMRIWFALRPGNIQVGRFD